MECGLVTLRQAQTDKSDGVTLRTGVTLSLSKGCFRTQSPFSIFNYVP